MEALQSATEQFVSGTEVDLHIQGSLVLSVYQGVKPLARLRTMLYHSSCETFK